MFGQMTKWVAQIDDPRRVPEYVRRAFQTATSGRPGPVVLALPEDMLEEDAEAPAAPRYQRVAAAPHPQQLERLSALLAGSRRPIVIAGGSGWTNDACMDLRRFGGGRAPPRRRAVRGQDPVANG